MTVTTVWSRNRIFMTVRFKSLGACRALERESLHKLVPPRPIHIEAAIKIISNNDTIVNNVGNGGVLALFQAPSGNALKEGDINLSFVGTGFVKLTAAGGLDGNQNRTSLGKRADVNVIDLFNSTSSPNISDNRLTILLRQTFTSS